MTTCHVSLLCHTSTFDYLTGCSFGRWRSLTKVCFSCVFLYKCVSTCFSFHCVRLFLVSAALCRSQTRAGNSSNQLHHSWALTCLHSFMVGRLSTRPHRSRFSFVLEHLSMWLKHMLCTHKLYNLIVNWFWWCLSRCLLCSGLQIQFVKPFVKLLLVPPVCSIQHIVHVFKNQSIYLPLQCWAATIIFMIS